MATVIWRPNAVATAQIDTLTGGGTPAPGNVITAVMGAVGAFPGVAVSYTLVSGDTLASAVSALLNLLSAAGPTVPQFADAAYALNASNANQIVATAASAGVPFTLSASSSGGGMTLTWAPQTAGSSPSDVGNANNWLRNGAPGLPQNGDTVVLANSSVPMLWNVTALQNVLPADLQRYQSMTGQVGLPDQNAAGYPEYRPTRLTFNKPSGSSSPSPQPGTLTAELGLGASGNNPQLERYDAGATPTVWTVLASGTGGPLPYAVDIVNTSLASTLTAVGGATVGCAAEPGQVAALASAVIDGGCTLTLGAGCTLTGKLTVTQGTAFLQCGAGSILAQQGSQITVAGQGLTYPAAEAIGGSTLTWLSNSNVVSLTLQTGSTFDKSGDVRGITVSSSTIDGDCVINDPHSAITYTTPTLVTGAVTSGPFLSGAGRTARWA